MCTIAAPASPARWASSPISFGVYGMAGHCSRCARTQLSAAEMTVLLLRGPRELTAQPQSSWGSSYRDVAVLAPGPVDLLAARLLDSAHDHVASLGWIDHVVDHRPPGGDVRADLLLDRFDHPCPCLLGVVGSLDLLVEDDVDRTFRPHHRDLGERPGHDHIGLIALAGHHVVPGAVGLEHDDGDLRNGRLRRRV